MKKIKGLLMAILVSMVLIGCGSDNNEVIPVVENNITNVFNFENSVVIIPTVNIPFEGGDFTITFIPQKDKNLILEENAIMITKTINGYVVDSDWAQVFKDVTHDVYNINASINYSYNHTENNISSVINLVYYTDGNTNIFQTINVVQMGNLIKQPIVTMDYEKFTVVTDSNGDITITENTPSDFQINSITDDDIINLTESLANINVNGNSKANASLSFVINNNTYNTQADINGQWSVDVNGTDLSLYDTFTVIAVGIDGEGDTYTDKATSKHLIKLNYEAAIYINNITEDNNVTINESQNEITVSGYVTGEITKGADIDLVVGGNSYKTMVTTAGTWDIQISGTELYNNNSTTVTTTTVDIAGNIISESNTKTYDTE